MAPHDPLPYKGAVLVIDDNPGVLDSLESALGTYGYNVITALNGAEGKAALEAHNPAIVVTDILMPDHDGLEIIMQIKRERPEVKIVAMSGGGRLGNTEYLTVATKLGADAVLEKPFDPSNLVDILRRLIGQPS